MTFLSVKLCHNIMYKGIKTKQKSFSAVLQEKRAILVAAGN
jgi:hypothetical protein